MASPTPWYHTHTHALKGMLGMFVAPPQTVDLAVHAAAEVPPAPNQRQMPKKKRTRRVPITLAYGATQTGPSELPGVMRSGSPQPGLPYVTVPLLAAEHEMTQSSSGVTLWQDRKDEAYYLEVKLDHDPVVLRRFLLLVDAIGLEVMDDDECPPEVLRDGSVRHWLAEKVREVIV